jgi:hypothetical protein
MFLVHYPQDLMLNPPLGREVHVVRAAKSTRWPEDLVEQLRTRAEEGGGGDGGG